jgi:hypothetical protein
MARRLGRSLGRQGTLFAPVAEDGRVPAETRQAVVDALADLLLEACREEPSGGGGSDEREDHA